MRPGCPTSHPAFRCRWSSGVRFGHRPDGIELYLDALGDSEGGRRVAVLPLAIDALRAEACGMAGRDLTREEWNLYMPADAGYRVTCGEWPLPTWR